MDYIKFNCFDLAVQNDVLFNVGTKLRDLSEKLFEILDTLDSQIKNYEDLQNTLLSVSKATGRVGMRILAEYNALDQIIDLYCAAENRALRLAEELPVEICELQSVRYDGVNIFRPIHVSIAAISSGDLYLEDWLAELVYKNSADEDKG